MGMMNKVCAFTGHRPRKLPWRRNETDSRCAALKAVLAEQIAALLAVDNGERRGGTAATMRYAQKMGREIIVTAPITRLISHG